LELLEGWVAYPLSQTLISLLVEVPQTEDTSMIAADIEREDRVRLDRVCVLLVGYIDHGAGGAWRSQELLLVVDAGPQIILGRFCFDVQHLNLPFTRLVQRVIDSGMGIHATHGRGARVSFRPLLRVLGSDGVVTVDHLLPAG